MTDEELDILKGTPAADAIQAAQQVYHWSLPAMIGQLCFQ